MQDIIQAGVKTKVMLLSATPVNNDLKDLRNQIYLVSEGQDHALLPSTGIASIKQTLDAAQKTFGQWAKRPVPLASSTAWTRKQKPPPFSKTTTPSTPNCSTCKPCQWCG